jgi:hypothetical protein
MRLHEAIEAYLEGLTVETRERLIGIPLELWTAGTYELLDGRRCLVGHSRDNGALSHGSDMHVARAFDRVARVPTSWIYCRDAYEAPRLPELVASIKLRCAALNEAAASRVPVDPTPLWTDPVRSQWICTDRELEPAGAP